MAQLTLTLPDELHARLRTIAEARGVSVEQVVREAVERDMAAQHPPEPEARPKPKSLGAGASGYTDTARRIGEERTPPRSWR
jgi:plasmid stability protein